MKAVIPLKGEALLEKKLMFENAVAHCRMGYHLLAKSDGMKPFRMNKNYWKTGFKTWRMTRCADFDGEEATKEEVKC